MHLTTRRQLRKASRAAYPVATIEGYRSGDGNEIPAEGATGRQGYPMPVGATPLALDIMQQNRPSGKRTRRLTRMIAARSKRAKSQPRYAPSPSVFIAFVAACRIRWLVRRLSGIVQLLQ